MSQGGGKRPRLRLRKEDLINEAPAAVLVVSGEVEAAATEEQVPEEIETERTHKERQPNHNEASSDDDDAAADKSAVAQASPKQQEQQRVVDVRTSSPPCDVAAATTTGGFDDQVVHIDSDSEEEQPREEDDEESPPPPPHSKETSSSPTAAVDLFNAFRFQRAAPSQQHKRVMPTATTPLVAKKPTTTTSAPPPKLGATKKASSAAASSDGGGGADEEVDVEEVRKKWFAMVDKDADEEVRKFQCLLALAISKQTHPKVVVDAMQELRTRNLCVETLANFDLQELSDLLRSIHYNKQKAKQAIEMAKLLKRVYSSKVPMKEALLVQMPGIGPKLAGIMLLLWDPKR